MQQKLLFQSCCRLCLDDTKQQHEISSVEKLSETLERLYDLKLTKDDRCSTRICVDCQQETMEAAKWLEIHEKIKQQIRANQERFAAEMLEQLGPEPAPPRRSSPSSRSARLSRRSTRRNATDTPTDEAAQLQEDQIKKEKQSVTTRSSRRRSGAKQEWNPPGSDREQSETPTSTSGSIGTSSGDNEEDDASTAESGTTSSSDTEFKCPRCAATFTELTALEKHMCKFVCSICSAVMKHKKSLRKHLMSTHNVKEDQWESYWNPPQVEGGNGKEQSLLVEGRKPRKRYRYESDSPTDIEDNADKPSDKAASSSGPRRSFNEDDFELPDELVKIYCSLCNESFSGLHDCPFVCDICGNSFALPRNVRRHKINVHKLDPDHPSLVIRRRSTSRPPSRMSSRAASEAGSDDDLPLAAVVNRSRSDSVASDRNGGGGKLYRFFCMDCDYTNTRRYRVTAHMKNVHGIPSDQIDPEAIQKELLGTRAKTPEPSLRTRHSSSGSRTPVRSEMVMTPFDEVLAAGGTVPPTDPAPLVPESSTVPMVVAPSTGFHRSRSRSTYQDDMDRKRKRSMSACSMREPRTNRAISERNVLVAKRQLTNAELLSRINSKFRNTVASIQANRLHIRPQLSCVPVGTPIEQPLRPRVSAFIQEEPCTNKRLYRRRAPVGIESTQVSRLRAIFQSLCDRVPPVSAVNAIDVDSLVLVPDDVLPPATPEEIHPTQQPEPDSTTPVVEEPMDTDDTPVVIELAEEAATTTEISEVVETVEMTEEQSEEIISEVVTEGQAREHDEEMEVVEKEEEEVEETVQVLVEQVREDDGGGCDEEILPD